MFGQFQNGAPRRRSPVGPPGVVLVITVLLVGLLLVMAMTMINLASSDYQVATNESKSVQALFNADAGMEEAKMRLSPNAPSISAIPVNTNVTWRGYILSGHSQAEIQAGLDPTYGKAAPNYTANESTSNYLFYNTVQTGLGAIPWGWARIQHKVDSGGNIVYLDALTGATTTSSSQVVSGVTVYNPPIVVVTAEGIQGPVRRMISMEFRPIVSTTTTTTNVVTDPFANAAHGVSSVSLVGNATTDSYDSRNGAYGGGNVHQHGDVSSDATAPGTISLNGNSSIHGNAQIGSGGNVSSGIQATGHATITGTQSTESGAWNVPLSTIPQGVTNQGALSLSGNSSRTLSTGTYWFTSISIAGNARLTVSGAVKIYVTGSIDIGGNGIATANNLPPNLLIYGTVDPNNSANKTTSVSIHGNGTFYGSVYAPAANISVVGNGANYGALTGNTVSINGNGSFHYDEALGNLGQFITTSSSTTYTTTGFSRYSWREIAF
jgi:hypothetical protein